MGQLDHGVAWPIDVIDWLSIVGGSCDGFVVDVRAEDIEGIPAGNLRVPRADFADVWRAAAQLGRTDAYAAGVAITCRWVACAAEVFNGRRGPSYAPITHTRRLAHEELLEREYIQAEKACIRAAANDDPHRPVVEGAAATLRWAWRGQGPAPIDSLRLRESPETSQ